MNNILFGIDFGSKFSGNTVIAIYQANSIEFMRVEKDVDADQFIRNAADHFKPTKVFIDAPLSLPGRYSGISDCSDYNFRKADMELKAMSPMFLGGLTARAIRIKDYLEANDICVYETYPKIMAGKIGLMELGYRGQKTALQACRQKIAESINPNIQMDIKGIKTWHHVDALLALISAMCHCEDQCEVFGDGEEGLIFV